MRDMLLGSQVLMCLHNGLESSLFKVQSSCG